MSAMKLNLRQIFPKAETDESVYVFQRQYFLAFLPWLMIGIGLIVMGLFIAGLIIFAFSDMLANPLSYNVFVLTMSAYFLLIMPFMTAVFISFYFDMHIVTDRRLIDIDQNTLFNRETNELSLEDVQDVTAKHIGIFSSVFDFGSVFIETASTTRKFEFKNVLFPREIAGLILDLSSQAKERMRKRGTQHIVPRTKIKAVIENKIFTSTEELYSIGAMVPHDSKLHSDSPPGQNAASSLGPPPDAHPSPAPRPDNPGTTAKDSDNLDIIIDEPGNQTKPR